MPDCPTCKKPMDFELSQVTTFDQEQNDIVSMQEPFPSEIKITMFQNFVCGTCGSRTKQAVQTATYKNPEIKEFASTR
jgi:hypothetical protein